MGKLRIIVVLLLLGQISSIAKGRKKEDQKEAIFKELVEIWRNGGGWNPHKVQPPPERQQDQQINSILSSIMGGLKSVGLIPKRSMGLPSLNKAFDRNRLSGFLYNISMYLQEMSTELDDHQQPFGDDQFWENLLYSLLQTGRDTSLGLWDGKTPPRPTFRLQNLFLSLRGSPHWDGLLGIVQSILTLTERQPQKPILTFVSQNWKTISALLETVLQALVSGTYGQAVAGLQGFICVLKGRNDCAFNLSWLQQLLSFMETRNWKPVVSLHPVSVENNQRDAALSPGRFKPFLVPPEVLHEEHLLLNQTGTDSESLASMQALLLQALSRSNAGERAVQFAERNPGLLQGLDNLRRGFLRNVGRSVYGNLRRKVLQMTNALLDDVSSMVGEPQYSHHGRCSVGDLRQLILWGIRHNLTWNAQAMGFSSKGIPSRPSFMSCPSQEEKITFKQQPSSKTSRLHQPRPNVHEQSDLDLTLSVEILEAACNASIPGLTGVSNFTVFLYCNIFEGKDDSQDPEVSHFGIDLQATCSDAAWYLSAAEEDFLWVHVCSEYFAHEFNKTVCANSTFWLQHAHQVEATKDYQYLNQTSIDDLCLQLSTDVSRESLTDATEDCLALLSSKTLTAQDFRRCFLPNNTALIASLCGNDSSQTPQDGSWAAEYCSKFILNHTYGDFKDRLCDYTNWKIEHFINSTALELCSSKAGLKDYICKNTTLYLMLVRKHPSLLEHCLNYEEKQGSKCVLQRLFDMLPAPYDFDTSQLCVNPLPILQEVIHMLTLCEGVVDERTGWLATVSYVLRVLDFMVGLSAGLEEGESEVRQGLSQAILLSSLQDNASFWATLRPNASISVLHTVGVFLKREQNYSLKEDLLSCFSPVLWDLIQREGNSSTLRFLMQEYLQMPRESIRTVVLSAEKDAVKRFLSHVHQSWDQLQVETIQVSPKEQEAMETMTAAFIHKFPRVTPELFIDLSQFIPYMSVSDIMTFPASLMANASVLMAISDHSSEMKSPQKQAFVKRLLQSSLAGDVPSWPPYFLSSILPLLPHLPVSHFQQLTSQQLTPLIEMLGNSSLDATRGRHVLRTVFNRGTNLSSDNIMRLGVLICYLNSEDLQQLLSSSTLSSTLWEQLARCVSEGHVSGSGRLSHWLGMALKSLNASVLSASTMASLHGMLPQIGASFLEPLSSVELLDLVTLPGMPTFPPAQAFQILNKIAEETNFSANTLCRLKPLFPGLGPSFLKKLVVPESAGLPDCRCWNSLLSDLQPALQTMVNFALQQALERKSSNITQRLQCLLPSISLKKLMSDLNAETVLQHISLYKNLPWSHQQAQMLFKMIHRNVNITRESILNLGRIAGGMSCEWLRLWVNESGFTVLLEFITKLPGGVRPALRKCIVAEIRKQLDIDLNDLDPSFAARLPLTMMEHLSNFSLIRILDHIQQHFIDFLQLPQHKQMALAEKAIEVLGISEDDLTGASMDMLGPLLPFLDRDLLAHADREALKLRLEELKQYCLPPDSLRQISALLTERSMMGEPKTWTVGDVEQVGRLVFTLSSQQIRSLPLGDLGKDTVEQVLLSQWLWKDSEVGKACLDLTGLREKINSLIQRIVKGRWWMRRGPIPSCADIKGTFPSAWRSYQLSRMKRRELKACVEFMGQDDTLDFEQREALWMELRPVYKPVRLLKPEQVLELGCIVTEMGERELQAVNLSNLAVVAHLGSLNGWSTKKMRAAVLGIMRRLKRKPEELGVVELVSLGHLLCGFSSSEIYHLDPFNLSVAALFLREMVLPCSEQQTEALTSRLYNPLGFGLVSSWGPEVFTEIGTLAAGLEDMLLSSLVKEQMEGLTPAAIALIPPRKLAVVFSATQLSWLSSEQACAVTEEQWAELDSEQRQALGMAQYEGELMLEHRGRNRAPSVRFADSFTECLLIFVCTLWNLL
ncbi:stereocilin-like [Myxocyprinus asiaticus]|uniref:stereocilin-like n=1 Tax=Myxocyprinus asiaticus TaxID=70543 RepID=UPI00222368E9|nr:stereocilin-like [Myxocyprinus asiaticus]